MVTGHVSHYNWTQDFGMSCS